MHLRLAEHNPRWRPVAEMFAARTLPDELQEMRVLNRVIRLSGAGLAYEADPRAPGVGERAHEDRVADHIAADALEQPPDRSQRG